MKPKVILTVFIIFLAVGGGFIKLFLDNARLKKDNESLIKELGDYRVIPTVSITICEVTGFLDKDIERSTPFTLDSAESKILLKEFGSKEELQITAFPQTSVLAEQDVTLELNGLKLRVSPEVGADGLSIALSISVKFEEQKTPALVNLVIWTGHTVVITSPRNSNSLLFLQAHIKP